jgi:hypothetical protein
MPHQLLKHVPHARFEELVKAHGADDGSRGLNSKSQLVALLYGQLSGAPSLRAIVAELESHAAALSELGCDPVKRSTLAEANHDRPAALFDDLLGVVLEQAHRGLRRPASPISRPPGRCRSWPVPPTSLTSATTITAGGPNCMLPAPTRPKQRQPTGLQEGTA